LAVRRGTRVLLVAASLSGLAFSADDTRSQAATILAELKKSPEAARVAAASIGKAEDALKRADQLRASGDQPHGALLEATALEWATASQLLDKAARSEKQLAELQRRTLDLEERVFRAQALVEQTVARRARAEEALRKLDEKAGKP
jgi:hypothetical protein